MTNLEFYQNKLCKYVDLPGNEKETLQDLIMNFMNRLGVDFTKYCGTDNMNALWWLMEEYAPGKEEE